MLDTILARRSIRKYTSEPVPDEMVTYLLRAAMAAPSAGNEQPWHFVVIRERHLLEQLTRVHPYAQMLHDANLAIMVCGDKTLEKYEGYWIQDCSAATENILIAAEDMGLGSVWLGVYPNIERSDPMRVLLDLPKNVIPFAIISVGFPAEEKEPANRYNPGRIHYDRW